MSILGNILDQELSRLFLLVKPHFTFLVCKRKERHYFNSENSRERQRQIKRDLSVSKPTVRTVEEAAARITMMMCHRWAPYCRPPAIQLTDMIVLPSPFISLALALSLLHFWSELLRLLLVLLLQQRIVFSFCNIWTGKLTNLPFLWECVYVGRYDTWTTKKWLCRICCCCCCCCCCYSLAVRTFSLLVSVAKTSSSTYETKYRDQERGQEKSKTWIAS